jgi:hypothetical protein
MSVIYQRQQLFVAALAPWILIALLPAKSAMAIDAPGRPVKVAALAIGFDGNRVLKTKLAVDLLDAAGKEGVDVACLPEEFAGTAAEAIPGPTTEAVGRAAAKHGMYVICPIREKAPDGRAFNTAVLLDRQGKPAGYYRKMFVFWGEGVNLGDEGVKVFDLDFGRIAILTCFDLNFAELWSEAERKGAEIVFWPSAYGGGRPLNGYAAIHNYYIVAVGAGNMIDLLGNTIEDAQQPKPRLFITTLDLDQTLVHYDFNSEKVKKLLAEHKGEVELEKSFDAESWHLLRAVKPGVRVRDLCRQYQIETLRDYRQRSRREINAAREKGGKI